MNEGDTAYFHKLGQYLTYFFGRKATPVDAYGPEFPDREQAWKLIREGLGLSGPVAVDDKVRLTPEGIAPVEGIVEWVSPSFLGVRSEDALYRFIVRRIIDSWRLPGGVARYYRWMLLGDDAVAARTAEGEWPRIAALLDRGIPVPLGLVTVSSTNPARLRHNHQVLAWAREREGGRVTLRVYDPNRGPRDDVTITFDTPAPAGFEHTLGIRRPVRGFFRVPYTPAPPPG
jgi:hypothetical protein